MGYKNSVESMLHGELTCSLIESLKQVNIFLSDSLLGAKAHDGDLQCLKRDMQKTGNQYYIALARRAIAYNYALTSVLEELSECLLEA